MYYYSPDTNRKGKVAAWISIGCYLALLILLAVFGKMDIEPVTQEAGILIDFGDSVDGSGEDPVAFAEDFPQDSQSGDPADSERMTQDIEDAPAVTPTRPETTQTTAVQPREVDRRALFPGRSSTSEAQSQGTGAEGTTGNAGHEAGAEGGAADGTGTGDSGISLSLAGRQPVGKIPLPVYPARNQQGTVVVRITVDAEGKVTTAEHEPQGSTTTDQALVQAAIEAARKARFTDDDNPLQTGTITYVFRLIR